MRILYLCHRIPYPPNKGDKIRAFHQLKALAARHEVDLFTLVDDAADASYTQELRKICRTVTAAFIRPRLAKLRALPYLLTSQPLTLPCFYSSELMNAVQCARARQPYDRTFVYCSAMAQYVKSQSPLIIDLVDVDSDKWAQYAAATRWPVSAVYQREANSLRRYERAICQTASSVVLTTEREAAVLRGICPEAAIQVIPNGVDTDFFQPVEPPALPAKPAIVFTGDMSYFPNQAAVVFFAKRVLPRIKAIVPGTRFIIVGRNPGREVLSLTDDPDVEVTGFVDDVRQYLGKASLSVAPFSIAAGIQNKIIEAMAFGLPVVATPKAVQGLVGPVAQVVRTAEHEVGLAEACLELLRDAGKARRIGQEGRRRVREEYDWSASLRQLVELVEQPHDRSLNTQGGRQKSTAAHPAALEH